MKSLVPNRRLNVPQRWTLISSIGLAWLALIVLLLWGNQAGAAASESLALSSVPPALVSPTNLVTPSICSRDIALVFDVSGSMGFDPVCRGC
jgi:hypothetical protein